MESASSFLLPAFLLSYRIIAELQGHAIKNQDLLIASGAISLKGSEGMNAVDDDLAAAVRIPSLFTHLASHPHQTHTRSQSRSLSSQSQSQLLSYDSSDSQLVAARTHSLTELANSISNLAELFKDLSTLIIDQGTLLDSVEYNIEQTAVRVSEAAVVLQEAKGYQGRTGRRKCIFFLVLLVMLAVTALVIKIRRGGRVRSREQGVETASSSPTTATVAPVGTEVEPGDDDPWESGRSRTRPGRNRRRERVRT